ERRRPRHAVAKLSRSLWPISRLARGFRGLVVDPEQELGRGALESFQPLGGGAQLVDHHRHGIGLERRFRYIPAVLAIGVEKCTRFPAKAGFGGVIHFAKSAMRGARSSLTVAILPSARDSAWSSAPKIRGQACSNSAHSSSSGRRSSSGIVRKWIVTV